MKNYFIILAFCSSFLYIACNNQSEEVKKTDQKVEKIVKTKKVGTYKNLDAAAFNQMMIDKPGSIIDVRELDEVKHGIIEGAVIAPLYADNFLEIINTLEKDKPVYIYDASGNLSVIAAKTFLSNEFSEIYGLMGGVMAWGMEGYKTVNPKVIKGEF